MIGQTAYCSSPRHYWTNGLFAPTTCVFSEIKHIDCPDALTSTDAASSAWKTMVSLESVRYAGHRTKVVPMHWALLNITSIDLKDTAVCTLPWILNPSLERIALPACAQHANWSAAGLKDSNFSLPRLDRNDLSRLKSINLSGNLLESVPRILSELESLQRVDFQGNSLKLFQSQENFESILGTKNPIQKAILLHDRTRMVDRLRELHHYHVHDEGMLEDLEVLSPFPHGKVNVSDLLLPRLRLLSASQSNVMGTIPDDISKLQGLGPSVA